MELAAQKVGVLTDENDAKYRKLATAIAGIDGSKDVRPEHAAEALQYLRGDDWSKPDTGSGEHGPSTGPGSPLYDRAAKVFKTAGLPEPEASSLVKTGASREGAPSATKIADTSAITRAVLKKLQSPKRLKDRMVAGLAIDHGRDTVNTLARQGLISLPGKGVAEITKAGESWLKANPEPRNAVQQMRFEYLSRKKVLTDKESAALDGLRAMATPGNGKVEPAKFSVEKPQTDASDLASRLSRLSDAVSSIAKGAEEVIVKDLRNDLHRYGGTNDVTLKWGDAKSGLSHVGEKRGAAVVGDVLLAVAEGDITKYVPGKETVHIVRGNTEAVLSLDEHGQRKTWLVTGWHIGEPDAASGVSAQSGATQTAPVFSRDDLGAGPSSSIIRRRDEVVNQIKSGADGASQLSLKGTGTLSLSPESIAKVQDLISRALPDGKAAIKVVDSITAPEDSETAYSAHGVTGGKITGMHQAVGTITTGEARSIITLAVDGAIERTGYHEVFHAAEALGLVSEKDSAILQRSYPDRDGVSSSERRADAFADFMENGTTPEGYARVLFGRIKAFLLRLKDLLTGKGWRTSEDVFRDLESGKMKDRAESSTESGTQLSATGPRSPFYSKLEEVVNNKMSGRMSDPARLKEY